MGMVYLLHFSRSLGSEKHSAQHYLGYADDLKGRLCRHRRGDGAAITRAAVIAGIKFEVVRTWEGDRELERRLKNQKNHAYLCPICREAFLRKRLVAQEKRKNGGERECSKSI